MRRLLAISLVLVGLFAAGWMARQSAEGARSADGPRLAGARATIEAIDYPTLQAAIDALPDEGGLVRIPAGEFVLDRPLVVHQEDVCLEGAGTATHIRNANEAGEAALKLLPRDLDTKPTARIWRVRVANLRLTGNPKSGAGVEAIGVNEIHLDGLSISNHGGDGVRLIDCYEDPRVSDCLMTYNKGAGLYLSGCHDIAVTGNQFEENQDAVRCLDGFNLCFVGNCIDDHLGNGVVIENTYGSVVSGNMIEECKGTGILLDRDCYGITLSANVIAHEMTDGIELRDAHGCAVSANTFTIVKRHALLVGPNSGRITISANNFSDSTIGPGEEKRLPDDRQAGGLVIDGAADVAVSGNLFSGMDDQAIELRNSPPRVRLEANVIVDETQDVPPAKP